jgi:hypothetical protein
LLTILASLLLLHECRAKVLEELLGKRS